MEITLNYSHVNIQYRNVTTKAYQTFEGLKPHILQYFRSLDILLLLVRIIQKMRQIDKCNEQQREQQREQHRCR